MVASIEYTEKIINTFGEAAEANNQTPAREGNTIHLTTDVADDVMITGDIHGSRRNFNLIRRLAALEVHHRRHLVLQEVCHGGPTYRENGGCMSHTVLEDVAALKARFPERVHFILSNHELAELSDYPIQKNRQMLNLLFRLGLQHMYGDDADRVRAAMFAFIRSCPLAVRVAEGIFISHSIPKQCDEREFDASIFTRELVGEDYAARSPVFDLVWGRDYRPENAEAFANLVDAELLIGGHEPCQNGFNTPNERQVIIDCCSPRPKYVILPVGQRLSQDEVVARLKTLG